jgi:outer membrane protein assembly factor BamB
MMRCTVILAAFSCLSLTALADNWPAWRGPGGTGHSKERDLPVSWSADENIRWKTPLPGPGNSSPIVWGDRIFVTQALDVDMRKNIAKRRAVLCFDRKDGRQLWQQAVDYPEKELTHRDSPYCSATPVTDGERVIASHGSAGVVCYDFEGKQLWHRDLGKCVHIWGSAASPIIWQDLVILNFGPGERTFLIAMNKRTGADVWKVEEPGGKSGEAGNTEWLGSWSTPVVAHIHGREELIMSWPEAVKSYNPRTGELLWTCKGLTRLVYTSPLVREDVVVAMSGYGGSYLAVKPGGSGDVTEKQRLWRLPSAPQRVGSGVIVGDHVYIANEPSTAMCIELKTGKTLWTERLGPKSWGTMLHADGKLYVTNSKAETFVLAANPKFELLSRNPLNEDCESTPAIADGELFIRTYKHLWCVSKKLP